MKRCNLNGKPGSAKAAELEVGQRPMPARVTPAQLGCPFTLWAGSERGTGGFGREGRGYRGPALSLEMSVGAGGLVPPRRVWPPADRVTRGERLCGPSLVSVLPRSVQALPVCTSGYSGDQPAQYLARYSTARLPFRGLEHLSIYGTHAYGGLPLSAFAQKHDNYARLSHAAALPTLGRDAC